MRRSSAEGASFEQDRERGGPDVESGGGADNVQKTSYVVGQGTDPNAPDPHGVTPAVKMGGGINTGVIVVAVIAVLVALLYGFGLFT